MTDCDRASRIAVMPEIPTDFRYPEAKIGTGHAELRNRVLKLTGLDLFPSDEMAAAFKTGLTEGDPIAERFAAETYHGELGAKKARELVERAMNEGLDSVPEAPQSLRALVEDFNAIPDWLDTDLVEEGAAVWRRWAYSLGAVGNAGTMDTYTESWLALPLSLSGGYAGERALHRYMETSRWWMEVSKPGAVLTPGSVARSISMHVRIMHVSVRARVKGHPEWDYQRWGLPISQSAMMLTLLGGSVAPALGLTALGYITTRREVRAVLHFNRYCGYLVGDRCDGYFPETIMDAWRILFMADSARSYNSAATGTELVESFPSAFAPKDDQRGLNRLRAAYHYQLQSGYSGFFMLPWNRKRYDLPSPILGMTLLLLRSPLIAGVELARRIVPGVDAKWQKFAYDRWERWYQWQSGGKAAEFKAAAPLRR